MDNSPTSTNGYTIIVVYSEYFKGRVEFHDSQEGLAHAESVEMLRPSGPPRNAEEEAAFYAAQQGEKRVPKAARQKSDSNLYQ